MFIHLVGGPLDGRTLPFDITTDDEVRIPITPGLNAALEAWDAATAKPTPELETMMNTALADFKNASTVACYRFQDVVEMTVEEKRRAHEQFAPFFLGPRTRYVYTGSEIGGN